MLDLLLATIVLPLLAAGGIFLASRVFAKRDVDRVRFWTTAVALVIAFGIFILVFVLRRSSGVQTISSTAQTPLLSQSVVRFQLHPALWSLALGLTLASCSFLLVALGHRANTPPWLAAIPLLLLSLALGALWSATPLTMIVTWALYDLALMFGQIAVGGERCKCVRSLALGNAATLLLWIGVVLAGDGTGSVQWALMPPGGAKMTVWMMAGLLRLGIYPLHFSTPSRINSSSALAGSLFLSPVIGWGLLVRLAGVSGGVLPVEPWGASAAALTLGAGGVLAWTARSSWKARRWIGMAMTGGVFLAAASVALAVGNQGPADDMSLAVLTLGSTSWILGVTVLFVGGGLTVSRVLERSEAPLTVASVIGALWMIGGPITLGFVAESHSVRDALGAGNWGAAVGFLVAEVFLVAAVLRWLFPAALPEDRESNLLQQVSDAVGLIVPALALVLIALAPNLILSGSSRLSPSLVFAGPGLIGWVLWMAALALGALLAFHDLYLRPFPASWRETIHDVVLLDWAYGLMIGAFERGFGAVRTIDDILGGRGALLWSFVLFLILILVLRVGQ